MAYAGLAMDIDELKHGLSLAFWVLIVLGGVPIIMGLIVVARTASSPYGIDVATAVPMIITGGFLASVGIVSGAIGHLLKENHEHTDNDQDLHGLG